jgi:hypothetical protein
MRNCKCGTTRKIETAKVIALCDEKIKLIHQIRKTDLDLFLNKQATIENYKNSEKLARIENSFWLRLFLLNGEKIKKLRVVETAESIYEKNKPENFSYDGVFYGDISRYDSIEYKIIKICKQYRSLELFCEELKRFAVSDTTGFIDISLEDYSRISPNTEE